MNIPQWPRVPYLNSQTSVKENIPTLKSSEKHLKWLSVFSVIYGLFSGGFELYKTYTIPEYETSTHHLTLPGTSVPLDSTALLIIGITSLIIKRGVSGAMRMATIKSKKIVKKEKKLKTQEMMLGNHENLIKTQGEIIRNQETESGLTAKRLQMNETKLKTNERILDDHEATIKSQQRFIQAREEESGMTNEQLKMAFSMLQETVSDKEILIGLLEARSREAENTRDEAVRSKEIAETTCVDMSDFVGLVAHDLRNPITTIAGTLDLYRQELTDDPSKKGRLSLCNSALIQMGSLNITIGTLLNASRFKGGITPQFSKISNLKAANGLNILNDALEQSKSLRTEKNIELSISSPESFDIISDPILLFFLIDNIAANAIKFTPVDGKMSISISQDKKKKYIIIETKDSGRGMTKKEIKSAFNKKKAKTTRGTNGERGLGMGLHMCKKIVDALEGEIEIQSKKDKGTTVSVQLPTKPSTWKRLKNLSGNGDPITV